VLGAGTSGYLKGSSDESQRQQLEIARLNEQARVKEQALVTAVQTQVKQLVKAEQNAKTITQKRNADIDAGSLKLRIPVKAPTCPVQTATDATPSTGSNTGTASAELDPTTAKSLVAITDEGDTAIRKLNTCISLYNEAYQTLKGN
jgi:hypothetical protein